MNQETIKSSEEVSFTDFLIKDKRNRTILWLAAVAIIVQFAAFKYLYPFASYIHGDSFSYLKAADQNLSINTYLIGYSKFLRLFNVFFKSDFALVFFQYLFIQCSVLFFVFTLFYFYKPRKLFEIILLSFVVFNPLFLHLGNLVSSDAIFLGLSLIWFTTLLWIIQHPTNRIIIWHSAVLFIAFTFRYNAMIYPVISSIIFCLSNLSSRQKLKGIALILTFCGFFVCFTCYEYKKLTGNWQYSPFSGWQLVNNAMYAYRYVDIVDRKPVTKDYQPLDNMIREYFDSTRDIRNNPQEGMLASTVYMWTKSLTLYKYRDSLFKKDSAASELKKWASMGPFYKKYGIYIIKKYPWHFLKYFIWPNANKYYAPPVEFLEEYNSGKNDVTEQAKNWFGYRSRIIKTRMNNKPVWILSFYPILSGMSNLLILCLFIYYFITRGWKYNVTFHKGLVLAASMWLINAGFTITASSAALRFQSFPILLTTSFVILLIDWMIKAMTSIKNEILEPVKKDRNTERLQNVLG